MTGIFELETSRLKLRQWRKSDWPAFAKLNADSKVMRYYPFTLTAEESNALAEKFTSLIAGRGWGFWAVEVKNIHDFIGFVGLHETTYALPVTPCVEIGWRLAKEHWGNGYATEAGWAVLKLAFEKLGLTVVYSFTSVANRRSRAVMQRLNMINTNNNFKHPMLQEGHPFSEHVLYKIELHNWKKHDRNLR